MCIKPSKNPRCNSSMWMLVPYVYSGFVATGWVKLYGVRSNWTPEAERKGQLDKTNICIQQLSNSFSKLHQKRNTNMDTSSEEKRKQQIEKYRKPSVKILSIMHLVCGVLSCIIGTYKLILQPVAYISHSRMQFASIGEGIFCGILFLATGKGLQWED